MPARSRVFSELAAEENAENGSSLSTFGLQLQDLPRPKRRKRNGMNARFDRMVEAMNVTHLPSSSSIRSRSRTRTGSSSASGSSLSYAPPDTPVDAYYDGLKAGALGEGFSVLKMKGSGRFLDEDSYSVVQDTDEPDSELPTWLSDTFSTLSKHHPLRMLIPKSYVPINPIEEESENHFAYGPDSHLLQSSQVLTHARASSEHADFEKQNLASPIAFKSTPASLETLEETPFSKPGPASSVIYSPFARSPMPLLPPTMPVAEYHTPALLHSAPSATADVDHNSLTRMRHTNTVAAHTLSEFCSSSPGVMAPRKSRLPAGHFVFSPRVALTSPMTRSHSDCRESEPPDDYPYHRIRPTPTPPLYYTTNHPDISYSSEHPPSSSYPTSQISVTEHPSCASPAPPMSHSFRDPDFSDASAFSTPGPGYYASRPPDSAPASSSSDPIVEDHFGMDVDIDGLEFQWKAFNRKGEEVSTGDTTEAVLPPPLKLTSKFKPCLRPKPGISRSRSSSPDANALQDSLDRNSQPDRSYLSFQKHVNTIEIACHPDIQRSSATDEFPFVNTTVPDSGNEPYEFYDPRHSDGLPEELYQTQPLHDHDVASQPESTPRQTTVAPVPPERPESTCPFAFSVPPQPIQVSMKAQQADLSMNALSRTDSVALPEREFSNESEYAEVQDPRTPSPSQLVFAPAPGIFISPLRGSSSTDEQIRGLDTTTGHLLDALDHVCEETGKENGECLQSSQLSTSTDSIRSWGDLEDN
ncbi:hypothetical protein VNI00_007408 [Paramarasmius palmivorus]|uniref:Uncharacterized protein n=1 Tax=Paramarasmius palmivorus TaxID=297713 RepID=A0AAW0D0D5_9AGAR